MIRLDKKLFLAVATAALPAPSYAQEAEVLAPSFIQTGAALIREGDNVRLDVGGQLTLRCELFDESGSPVQNLPSGAPLADADPQLRLQRGPSGGVEGELGTTSATVNLTVPGLYVFDCAAGNPSALGEVDTSVRVAVARAADISRTEARLVDATSGADISRVEAGQEFNLVLRAYSSSVPERLVRPSNTQIIFRQGNTTCQTGGAMANQQFSSSLIPDWTAEEGIVRTYTALQPGRYTAVVNQLDGQGASVCDALSLTVVEDLFAPEITLRFPEETHQLLWREDLLRVSGRVFDSGSGIASVRVSNGHWSEDARLFETQTEGEMSFYSDLPFARGLQILTITAQDESGRTARTMESVYVGEHYATIRTGDTSIGSFNAVRQIALRPGRSLVRNNRPGIDSLSEIAALSPELLSLLGSSDLLAPVSVDENIDQSFLENVENLFKPDLSARGTIVPGRLDVSISSGTTQTFFGDTFDLRVGIPISGDILMICDGATLGWERGLCAAGGASSGEFDVNISGSVVATLPVQITTIGGLTIYALPKELDVRDNLRVSNGLGNSGEINNSFRQRIVEEVGDNLEALLWSLPNCPEDADDRTECRPEPPFVTFSDSGLDGRPDFVGVSPNGGETLFPVDISLPQIFGAQTLSGTAGLLLDTLRIDNGRISSVLSANLEFDAATPPEGVIGALLDGGTVSPGQERFPELPDLSPIFGSGNHDVQALVHRNALNEAIAQYWATGALDYTANMFEVLDAANFFENDPLGRSVAQVALENAALEVEFGAPPRITAYDGARGMFAELGDVRVRIDMQEDFESLLEFEVALITSVDLESTGTGLAISLSDPTGCDPSPQVFMACNGRFEVGLRRVEGFLPDGPRPEILRSDELYAAFLEGFGLRDADGERADDPAVEAFYKEAFADAIADYLADPFTFDFPQIPLPAVEFGRLQIAPLAVTNIELHPTRDGGQTSGGWLGVEFNLRASQ